MLALLDRPDKLLLVLTQNFETDLLSVKWSAGKGLLQYMLQARLAEEISDRQLPKVCYELQVGSFSH